MMAIEYVDSTQLNSDLTSVANAIRAKSGGSSQLAFPAGFVSEIGNIPSGGGDTDGLEDVAFNYAGLASGSVENNRLINYTPVRAGGAGGVWLFLKRTIPLVLNDVIKVTFSNRTYTTASWSDFYFLTPQATTLLGNTPLKKSNFNLSNTTEITATLVDFDSTEVYALILTPRGTTNIVAYSADIHVYVNDVLVF